MDEENKLEGKSKFDIFFETVLGHLLKETKMNQLIQLLKEDREMQLINITNSK